VREARAWGCQAHWPTGAAGRGALRVPACSARLLHPALWTQHTEERFETEKVLTQTLHAHRPHRSTSTSAAMTARSSALASGAAVAVAAAARSQPAREKMNQMAGSMRCAASAASTAPCAGTRSARGDSPDARVDSTAA